MRTPLVALALVVASVAASPAGAGPKDARAGHEYVATCRVRLKSSVGDVTVRGDAGFRLTTKIDHTGKTSGKVSFLVDPASEGWYGFSIGAAQTWWTTGCWVEEA